MNNSVPRFKLITPGKLLVLLVLMMPVTPSAADTSVRDFIEDRVSAIQKGHTVRIHDITLASAIVLPALYERRDYAPVWSNPVSVNQLINAIENIDAEGLDPGDYNLDTLRLVLERAGTGVADPQHSADLDLLLTDSLVRLGYHLAFGKVDPEALDPNWNMTRYIDDLDALLALAASIEDGRVDALLQSLKPRSIKYERLRAALAKYRLYQQLGGWDPIPDNGDSLKPGMVDDRVPVLRARLIMTGDLSMRDMYFTTYDDALAEGVARFQRRHGLEADGVAGPRTLRELNVPVETRINQIRANLERTRWVMHDLPETFIMVDIAGFNVRMFRNREVIWESRAVVGQPYRMSPIFRSTLTYLDLNPTWTVPPIVLEKDLLPELRKDPTHLEKKDMQVIDYAGNPVDPGGIDWNRYTGKSFPWLIRQQPGPKNALGRIKFMFPNPHSVYLHDTPSKSLFEEPERAFSSGCIRIEHPLELAELLLEHNAGWDRGNLLKAVNSLATRSISLAEPVTIILMYWTVGVDEDGTVSFNRDIYLRDPLIIQGLREPFSFRNGEIIRTRGEMAARL